MIPLGSCTMKLNATTEMEPVGLPGFADVHPFAPLGGDAGLPGADRPARGDGWPTVTGYAKVSVQPNAGSQGELAGLLAIRAYHESRGEHERDVCLIPSSAHGTNAASAVMAGMRVVVVGACDDGTVDLGDLGPSARSTRERLAAIMVTYPSTHGVYEEGISAMCEMVHRYGGQVYIDGANLNALLGLAQPGEFGGDVSHLNLHKTFCIPHGGGGPGVGPVAVAEHLVPFLPSHPMHPRAEQRLGHRARRAPRPTAAPGSWPSAGPTSACCRGADWRMRPSRRCWLPTTSPSRLASSYPILYTGQGTGWWPTSASSTCGH